jgi:hypothetical protein
MMSFQCDQFAVDRAGLTLTFLTPATGREIVFGKAAGGLAAFAIPVGIGTIAAVALHPRGSPAVWIGAIGCVFAAYLAQSPFAALMAAWFPAPFDLSRLRGGNPHPLASILSSVLSGRSLGSARRSSFSRRPPRFRDGPWASSAGCSTRGGKTSR